MDYLVFSVSQLTAHLQALRKARGLTQTQLGQLLGVKQSRIADIEKDPGAISVAQLHKLMAALGAQMVLRDTRSGWIPARVEEAPARPYLEPPGGPRTEAAPSGARTRDATAGTANPGAARKRGGTW